MSYTKTTWQDGDIITTEKLNKIESGIESSLSNELLALYKTMAGKDWPYGSNPPDAEVINKIAADASGSGGSSDFEIILTLAPNGGPMNIITDVTFEEIEAAVTAGKNIVFSGPDPSDNTKRRACFSRVDSTDGDTGEVTALSAIFGMDIMDTTPPTLNVGKMRFIKQASASPANVSLSFAEININT